VPWSFPVRTAFAAWQSIISLGLYLRQQSAADIYHGLQGSEASPSMEKSH